MEHLKEKLNVLVIECVRELYDAEVANPDWQLTRKEFTGDLTLVVFPFLRFSKKNPEETGREIGEKLIQHDLVVSFNVVKGFLNLEIAESYWQERLAAMIEQKNLLENIQYQGENKGLMVEFSSPNTNKPLHLGHIRNCLLGDSISYIKSACGYDVKRAQIINDRGIHICKSMVAWLRFANGETPEQAGIKGDHLIGKYYVAFDQAYKKEIASLIANGMTEEEAKKKAPIMEEARAMLLKWEENDPEVMALWKKMNDWVYTGFDATYKALGISFDKNYYESETYKLGKKAVEEGLKKGVFYRNEDGSVWIDLREEGLDEKLLLRSDGTSVYMTQDIGTAIMRFEDFPIEGLVYTVGNEQDYHFKVLFLILKKLGYEWAQHLYHLSYGMVDLPTGKMKSREGTVVDADDLLLEMYETARSISEELGKTEGLSQEEKEVLYHQIGLGALKYYILKVDPRKRMTFNPAESIDFNGHTGPFIQYAHARICSLLRRAGEDNTKPATAITNPLNAEERELIKMMEQYPAQVKSASDTYNPAVVAAYLYDLVKRYNVFYQKHSIFQAGDKAIVQQRLAISFLVSRILKDGMGLLGIVCPERM